MNRIVVAAAVVLSAAAFAQDAAPAPEGEQAPVQQVDKPSPEAIKSFWTYYFKGKGNGPALADAKLCLEIAKDGDNKNDCAKEAPAEGVKAGTTIYLWQAYLLPSGENADDMMVQVKLGDTVRETKDFKLKGESIRTRNWTGVRLPKAGTWTLVLLKGTDVLGTYTVKAN